MGFHVVSTGWCLDECRICCSARLVFLLKRTNWQFGFDSILFDVDFLEREILVFLKTKLAIHEQLICTEPGFLSFPCLWFWFVVFSSFYVDLLSPFFFPPVWGLRTVLHVLWPHFFYFHLMKFYFFTDKKEMLVWFVYILGCIDTPKMATYLCPTLYGLDMGTNVYYTYPAKKFFYFYFYYGYG